MGLSVTSVIACVVCLFFILSTEAVYSIEKRSQTVALEMSQSSGEFSVNDLRDRIRGITVKIIGGETWGSGILIQKQGQIYTVLTNAHVLRIANSYQIQTPDGKIYSGQPSKSTNFHDEDLGLLTFRSTKNYAIASIATSSLAVGDETFAAGFPNDTNTWLFTTGKVEYVLPQAFQGGYQMGYSNDIFRGMSGGPVLNRRGELVAINGRHKHPLWGNPYVFQDGSTPRLEIRQQMEYSSWAVPVQTFLQHAPQFAKGVMTPPAQPSSPTLPVSQQRPTPQPRSGWFW